MSASSTTRHSDAQLWLKAAVGSLILNGVFLLLLAFLVIKSLIFQVPVPPDFVEPEEIVVTIVPMQVVEEPALDPEDRSHQFARTSPDQAGPAPDTSALIGELDTRATSDAPALADAPDLPSQAGEKPRDREMETTESNYQDGDLAHDRTAAAAESETTPMKQEPPQELVEAAEASEESGTEEALPKKDDPALNKDQLVEGPFPYDRPAPMEVVEEQPKPSPDELDKDQQEKEKKEEVAENIKPKKPSTPADPGFRGNQRKTELKGSISRKGRSALDVKAGPLGRYHSALSRAIEKSWQRQVVKNRDYITPGVIRIRVVLDAGGRVRSVGTVEEFGIGVIQRGFTHRAIHEADLPTMPKEVKSELDGEPLELLYNFIF